MFGKTIFEHLFPHWYRKIRHEHNVEKLIEFWQVWENLPLLRYFITEAEQYDNKLDEEQYRKGMYECVCVCVCVFD